MMMSQNKLLSNGNHFELSNWKKCKFSVNEVLSFNCLERVKNNRKTMEKKSVDDFS